MSDRTGKYMQSFNEKWLDRLRKSAQKRGITLQQMVRAVIVPEWYRHHPEEYREQ